MRRPPARRLRRWRACDCSWTSELSSWKETLGLINTYSGAEELGLLCNQLGERLEAECGDSAAATLCYMCAANIAKVTELRQNPNPSPNPS